jgi:(p)ppGpp synthase/HD superfamily hydrolase
LYISKFPGKLAFKFFTMAKSTAKKERFKNVAGRRVQKVLDDLESLSKCANKATYDYTEEDIRKMVKAITDKVNLLKMAFSASSKSGKQTFEF